MNMPVLASSSDTENQTVDGTDLISGYSVPMDPMDLLQCDSCQ
jgi:hypothetical protein